MRLLLPLLVLAAAWYDGTASAAAPAASKEFARACLQSLVLAR